MKANTYVVKPFGISEVKVIALKGDPGTPTQEQINTAVDEYMTEHPEAQITDGSITEQKLSSDVVATLNDVDNKADKVGSYPDLIAGTADNLLSSSYQTDKTPYILRRTPYGARERGSIVGGSVVWNQLEQGRTGSSTSYGITFSYSDGLWTFSGTCTQTNVAFRLSNNNKPIQTGHKILLTNTSSTFKVRLQGFIPSTPASTPGERILEAQDGAVNDIVVMAFNMNGVAVNETDRFGIFDLTLMFGSTIADYIYSQEQASAGAGVAFFRSLFSKPYYAYNAGEIISVNTSAHKMVGFNQFDADSTLIPLGFTKEADGSYYLQTAASFPTNAPLWENKSGYAGQIYFRYEYKFNSASSAGGRFKVFYADGTSDSYYPSPVTSFTTYSGITRKGKKVQYIGWDFGSGGVSTWFKDICINFSDPSKNGTYEPYTAHTYPLDSSLTLRGLPKLDGDSLYYDGDIYPPSGEVERRYAVRAYQSGDESDANVLTDGTNTVYKLATPTTEQAEPYTALQICDPAGTEEWVGASMPVGHETKYYADLKGKIEDIPDVPTASGTYVLKATVSASGVTYSWVEG